MIGDLVAQIGGDLIEHSTLINGDIDPHSYELVKGDDELFTSAQIVFCHGDNLEHGASLHSQIHEHSHAVQINQFIEKNQPHLMIDLPEGGTDPHLWLDASLWAEAVDPIADHLSQALPENEQQIRLNAKALKEEILKTDRWILENFAKIDSSKKYLVSTHDAFRYFSRHYLTDVGGDFNLHAVAPEGVAPEGQIGFHQIKSMVDFVIIHKITYLFQESNLRPDSLKKICSVCASKGIEVKIFPEKLFADTTGNTPIGKGAYISMMKTNAKALIEAWQSDAPQEEL